MVVQARLGDAELRCDISVAEAVVAAGLREVLRHVENRRCGSRDRPRGGALQCNFFRCFDHGRLILTY